MRHDVAVSATIEPADARAFLAVVDAGSITAAAKLLGETKGSVSRRVARLERGLGVALLRRSPRLVQATEAGLRYRKDVGAALALFDHASESVRGERERPAGRLRITAPIDLATTLLPEPIARFAEAYPEVRVEMLASDERLDFDAQRLDCALRVGSLRDSSLKVHKLADLDLGLFASPAYLARASRPRKPSELSALRFVAYAGFPRPFVLPLARGEQRTSVSLEPTITGDGAFVHAVLVEGGGLGALPRLVARSSLEAGRLEEVLPSHRVAVTAPLSLLYPAGAFVPAKVRAFRDFLEESCALRRRCRRSSRPT